MRGCRDIRHRIVTPEARDHIGSSGHPSALRFRLQKHLKLGECVEYKVKIMISP